MVRIRMKRMGAPHKPFYRINAVDQRAKRDGRVIEQLGWYDPMAADESKQLSLNLDRIKYWVSVGAQPSGTIAAMLAKRDVIDRSAWEKKVKARADACTKARGGATGEEKKD